MEDGKFTDLDENEYDLNGYMIIFTSNLEKNTYQDKIPAPIISRFSMLYNFSNISIADKNKFIKYRIQKLINKYYDKYKIQIEYNDIIEKIDINKILKLDDLRQMNRIIRKEFLNIIKNIEI